MYIGGSVKVVRFVSALTREQMLIVCTKLETRELYHLDVIILYHTHIFVPNTSGTTIRVWYNHARACVYSSRYGFLD